MKNVAWKMCTVGVLTVTTALVGAVVPSAQFKGPSTALSPDVLPSQSVVSTSSLLSVGDAIDGYRMVGIPDGLGAFDNGDGTFTVLMNHELTNNVGIKRVHGGIGAFVSKWIINKQTMQVVSGSDLMQRIYAWDAVNQIPFATLATTDLVFNRFCSGDLPAVTAFYNPKTGLGTQARIYMHGEEAGVGRQFGSVATGPDAGSSYVLGKFNLSTNGSGQSGNGSWENALASPYPQDKTIVIANSDGGAGIQNNAVAVYVGTKLPSGATEVDKAGLTNGTLKFVRVANNPIEVVNTTTRATNITSGTPFTLSSDSSTTFSRPEDGAWDPLHPNLYYFVTTDQLDVKQDTGSGAIGQTRLWRLNFKDIKNPDLGGTIDLVIDGRIVNGEKVNMFDNIAINEDSGVIVLLEDVGNASHNGKVWLYDPATDGLKRVAHHDMARFGDIGRAPTADPSTIDEEASGVIDMSSILGPGFYLTSDQAHYVINSLPDPSHPGQTFSRGFTNPDELVEGGQLLIMRLPYPVADSKDRCKSSGWGGMFRADGSTFKNQGDCIQYVNTGK